jgi:hypothetical protein
MNSVKKFEQKMNQGCNTWQPCELQNPCLADTSEEGATAALRENESDAFSLKQ